MSEPLHDLFRFRHSMALWLGRPVDHQHRQFQGTGGIKFCAPPGTTGVFGNDEGDAVLPQEREVVFQRERAARQYSFRVWQGERCCRRVHQPEQIEMGWIGGENMQPLAADSEEDSPWRGGQSSGGIFHTFHMPPIIFRPRNPGWAFQRQYFHTGFGAGGHGVAAHLGGEGMGGVDEMGDGVVTQIGHQPRHAAKAANPHGQRLRQRGFRAAGVGKNGVHARRRQASRHEAGFCSATKQKHAGRGMSHGGHIAASVVHPARRGAP